jgi:D-3-phosphoglycerate dehydrogenase
VFEREPTDMDNPLLGLDNFICTPHMAAMCSETMSAVAKAAAKTVVDHMRGKPIPTIVNL